MNLVPDHRVLLGVDVVKSASNPGYHLAAVSDAVTTMLDDTLRSTGVESDVLRREFTGDGELLTLPARRLGSLFDLADRLNQLAEGYNRWRKPEIKLRIAVEVGPVEDRRQLTEPMISLARMLNAPAFKELFRQCLNTGRDRTQTALICSDHAWRAAFGGDHTLHVRREDFAVIQVRDKEYEASARVRIPGFDADCLARMIGDSGSPNSAVPPNVANPDSLPGRSAPVMSVQGDATGNVVAEWVTSPVTINNRRP
jgi:hypothetical protein